MGLGKDRKILSRPPRFPTLFIYIPQSTVKAFLGFNINIFVLKKIMKDNGSMLCAQKLNI